MTRANLAGCFLTARDGSLSWVIVIHAAAHRRVVSGEESVSPHKLCVAHLRCGLSGVFLPSERSDCTPDYSTIETRNRRRCLHRTSSQRIDMVEGVDPNRLTERFSAGDKVLVHKGMAQTAGEIVSRGTV